MIDPGVDEINNLYVYRSSGFYMILFFHLCKHFHLRSMLF